MQYNLLVILGATATGKTTLAVHIAKDIGGEIISADSRQIYRGMDIGTGKDLNEYTLQGETIPYHLINIADAGYKYNVFEYQQDFVKTYKHIIDRRKMPIVCGGTGLYLEAVLKGYKLIAVPKDQTLRDELEKKTIKELEVILRTYKELHNTTDLETKKRAIRAIEIERYYASYPEIKIDYPKLKPVLIGIKFDRESRRKRITERLKARLNEGMAQEVEQLIKNGVTPQDLIYYGLEYKFITQYIIGELTYNQMFNSLNIAIHQFAKRQMTWFRRMERNGMNINWLDGCMPLEDKKNKILQLLKK